MDNQVIVQYLEMLRPEDHLWSGQPGNGLEVIEAQLDLPSLNKGFYEWVGGPWKWIHKRSWTDQQWREYVEREEFKTYVGYVKGTPIGYFDIELQPSREVQILYFGLFPQFIGKGFGGKVLSRAIEICWSHSVDRVWLHTCTLDHPTAIKNYLKRGFKVFKSEIRSG